MFVFQVMHEPPSETVTYIVQQAPIEAQLVRIDQPDLSIPPPQAPSSASAHFTEAALVADQTHSSHQVVQPVTVNEYGQQVEVVEIIQPQPSVHHMPGQQAPVPIHTHPAIPRYPGIPPSSSSADAAASRMIPSLMDLELQNSNRRSMASLPPIEVCYKQD